MMMMIMMKAETETDNLRPPQSDFLSLLACRRGTGHSMSTTCRLHRSLHSVQIITRSGIDQETVRQIFVAFLCASH